MINEVRTNSLTQSNVSFKGNFIRKLFLQPTIKKLEKNLSKDTVEIFGKHPEDNKFVELLKKTTDFLLSITADSSINTTKKSSQLVKLAKLNSQYDSPEFFTKTEQLVDKARRMQRNGRFFLTHNTFNDVASAEQLHVEILKKKNTPVEDILDEIKSTSRFLRIKITQTVDRLKSNNMFYSANVRRSEERMYESTNPTNIKFRANRLLYGEEVAYREMQKDVKHQVLFSYEMGLNNRKTALIGTLENKLVDQSLPPIKRYRELQKLKASAFSRKNESEFAKDEPLSPMVELLKKKLNKL